MEDDRLTELVSEKLQNTSSIGNGALDYIRPIDGCVEVRGWACELHEDRLVAIDRVALSDGCRLKHFETAPLRYLRPDVCESFHMHPSTAVGFTIKIDPSDLNSDISQITVFGECRDGNLFRIHAIECDEGDPFQVLRDQIANSSTLPSPGHGTPIPDAFGMHIETRESFLECAGEHVLMMARYGGLRPDAHFLDIGCGLGRIAIGLSQYLNSDAEYFGFDIAGTAIQWAHEHVAALHPHYSFRHLDLQNEYYNPNGHEQEDRFPVDKVDFDFAYLGSVFTHMLLRPVEDYLRQANEHLKVGGTLFATFFLMNQEADRAIRLRRAARDFKLSQGLEHYVRDEPLLSAVSHNENEIFRLLEECGFKLERPPIYGNWTGTRQCRSHQDIIVAKKV